MEKARLKDFERELRSRVTGDVYFDNMTRGIYSTDASMYQITPVAVVLPKDEADACAAVRTAAEYNVSILPRGGGTTLDGQCVNNSMVIDFTKYMNQILELNVQQRWVRVQPGIVLDVLNAELARHGLIFAPDPATSNRCTIGGMMGHRRPCRQAGEHIETAADAVTDRYKCVFVPLTQKIFLSRRTYRDKQNVRVARSNLFGNSLLL